MRSLRANPTLRHRERVLERLRRPPAVEVCNLVIEVRDNDASILLLKDAVEHVLNLREGVVEGAGAVSCVHLKSFTQHSCFLYR